MGEPTLIKRGGLLIDLEDIKFLCYALRALQGVSDVREWPESGLALATYLFREAKRLRDDGPLDPPLAPSRGPIVENMTVAEAAGELGIHPGRVRQLAQENKFVGAVKDEDGFWHIPRQAVHERRAKQSAED